MVLIQVLWEGPRHCGKGSGIVGRAQALWEGPRYCGKGSVIMGTAVLENQLYQLRDLKMYYFQLGNIA